jgi:hypothetical protein
MAKTRVELDLRGLNGLMSSAALQNVVDGIGADMAAEAGPGFEYVARPHRWVARGFVQVTSGDGARRQARDAVLERIAARRTR